MALYYLFVYAGIIATIAILLTAYFHLKRYQLRQETLYPLIEIVNRLTRLMNEKRVSPNDPDFIEVYHTVECLILYCNEADRTEWRNPFKILVNALEILRKKASFTFEGRKYENLNPHLKAIWDELRETLVRSLIQSNFTLRFLMRLKSRLAARVARVMVSSVGGRLVGGDVLKGYTLIKEIKPLRPVHSN